KAFSRAGRPGAVRRLPAYIAWRIGIIASLVLTVFLTRRVTDVASYRHEQTTYFVIRLVIGGLYIWCALRMHKAASTLPTLAPPGARPGYFHPPPGPTPSGPYYPPGHPMSTAAWSPPQSAWPPPQAGLPAVQGGLPAPAENPWAAPTAEPTTDGQLHRPDPQ